MKKYFTIINILLITAVIYFSVKASYKIIVAQLDHIRSPAHISQTEILSDATERRRPLSHYKKITERNLFKTKTKVEKKIESDNIEPPQLTELELKLWGTVTGPGSKDYAVIQDIKKREQNLYEEGDTVQDATIKKIFREKIVLNVNGKDEILKLEEFRSGSQRSASRRSTTSSSRRSSSSRNINLKRSQIEDAMSNVNNLMRQAKIRPHFRNGKPDGLTLSRIRSNSIFRKLGLRSGDVITGVDGEKIRSVDDALKFYENLKSSSDVSLEIKRRGRVQTINYNIQ